MADSGKSTLAGQLAVGVSTTGNWIGLPTEKGPVNISVGRRRTRRTASQARRHRRIRGYGFYEVPRLTLVSLAGHDAVMGAPDKKTGQIRETPICGAVMPILVEDIEPRCVIIDTLADVFAGNEIIRAEARQFVGILNGLAIQNNLAVIVLSHPSLSGMSKTEPGRPDRRRGVTASVRVFTSN